MLLTTCIGSQLGYGYSGTALGSLLVVQGLPYYAVRTTQDSANVKRMCTMALVHHPSAPYVPLQGLLQ